MPVDQINGANDLLLELAEKLDIPDYLYEEAILKYENIGEWLLADDSTLKNYSPVVYTQGSFRLGTVVHPFNRNHEYDVDLVCCLQIKKESVTQEQLKGMIGDRLKMRDDLKEIITPSRRCWLLDYPKQFHMDVLPAILNFDNKPTGIYLTDTDLRNWQQSNPIAYAEWFKDRMRVFLDLRKAVLAKSINANVEDVPDWQVKTPLQRVVQLLKRHRDVYFRENEQNKPISIIITTLSALCYKNQCKRRSNSVTV